MTRLLALLLALVAPLSAAARQDAPAYAVVNVNVIPMDEERVLPNHTVLVEGDRITLVAPTDQAEIPDGAEVVDGGGAYLLPGLAEMHGHIPSPQAPAEYTENVLFLFVANGITTVRGMLGFPNQLELRERVNRGEIIGPNLYLAGPSFSGASINSPEEARERVLQQVAEGWDLLKVHPGLTREEYDAMAETANELGIRFGGHVPADVGLLHAIEMGQETFDHIDGYIEHLDGGAGPVDEAALEDIVVRSREAGAWVVPTSALWEVLLGYSNLDELMAYEELRYAPAEMVENWRAAFQNRVTHENFVSERSRNIVDNRTRILRALHEGGARILMGTDAPQQFSIPGFSLHRELERMEAAGMSPYEILVTGSVNVGEYFADHDTFGRIEAGHRADFFLVDGNPLNDLARLRHVRGVMVSGRWLSQEDISSRLNQIEAAYARD